MAARNEAKIKFTADTKQLTAEIMKANGAMASLRSAVKLNEAEYRNGADAVEYLKNKHQLLESQLEANRMKQDALSGKLDMAKQIYGENSREAQNWARKLTEAKVEQERLTTALNDCEKEIEEQRKATEKAQTPLEQLTKAISEQKERLSDLKTQYMNVALEQGESSDEAKGLMIAIDNLNDELGENEGKLKAVKTAVGEAGDEAEESGKKADEAGSKGWTMLKDIVADLASNAIQDCIDKLKEFGLSVMQLGIDFSSSMSNVQALSGATDEELGQLEKRARELGKSTIYSATDVADAMGYMALAGWETEDMLAGVDSVLNLAASASMDLAQASDIVTDYLSAFGMEASEASRLTDIMARTSSKANTNVEQMGEAFKFAAPNAGAMGYTAEDTSLAIGLMANNGIKASQAGTTLRGVLSRMAKPTEDVQDAMDLLGVSLDDGEGNMYSLKEVMEQLRRGFGSLKISEEELNGSLAQLSADLESGTITQDEYDESVIALTERAYGAEGAMKAEAASALAGKNALSGLLAIVSASPEDFDRLSEAINTSEGSAAAMAETMQDNLGGDIKELNSAFEEMKLHIFEDLENPARQVVTMITEEVIPAATSAYDWISKHQALLIALGVAFGIITGAMALQSAVQAVKIAMDAAEVASLGALIAAKVAAAGATLAALAPYLLIAAAIAAVIAIIVLCVRHWDEIKAVMLTVVAAIRDKVVTTWNNLKTTVGTVVTNIKNAIVTGFNAALSKVREIFDKVRSAVTEKINAAKEAVRTAIDAIKGFFNFEWSLPSLKMPHFRMEGGFSLMPPSVPHIAVDWYASGAVFNRPTLFATGSGFSGVGEAGPEAVSPISVLQDYVSDAVERHVPEIDYDRLGEKIADSFSRIDQKVVIGKREFGRIVREVAMV